MKYNTLSHLDSPLNRSVSKQSHAFPRADRFALRQRIRTQLRYELPSTLDKRGCGIGYGKKISLALDRCSPPPGNYKLSSEFGSSRYFPKIPGFSRGRNQIKFGSYLQQAQAKAKITPSPDKYDIKIAKNRTGGRIGERVFIDYSEKNNSVLPGPAHYLVQATNMAKNQTYILSTFKKSISPRYYKQQVMSTYEKINNSPFYEIADKEFGKSRVSKFRNVSITKIGHAKRQGIVDKSQLSTPGFKYNVFSEFGTIK